MGNRTSISRLFFSFFFFAFFSLSLLQLEMGVEKRIYESGHMPDSSSSSCYSFNCKCKYSRLTLQDEDEEKDDGDDHHHHYYSKACRTFIVCLFQIEKKGLQTRRITSTNETIWIVQKKNKKSSQQGSFISLNISRIDQRDEFHGRQERKDESVFFFLDVTID